MIEWLSGLWFRHSGWKIRGEFPYPIPKMVIAAGPHTSAWDFIIGLAVKHELKIKQGHFLGKKELFEGPFGWFFRKMGGIPVDRSSSTGLVDQVVAAFSEHDQFILAMSPEGTRKRVDRLKTGFYHIAKEAQAPILPIGFDFLKKEVIIGEPLYPSNETTDMKHIITFLGACHGKHPEKGLQHVDINATLE
jgi:1-acyl-sn-glycerol-3-phosphate acyltransferase